MHGDIEQCLRMAGIDVKSCVIKAITCRDAKEINGSGIYIFMNGQEILYVGESNNIARRVWNEHCNVRIGASEGVVRFLMYYLDDVCSLRDKWLNLSTKDREDFIRENILKPLMNKLTILIITCPQLKDPGPKRKNERRRMLEECVRKRLNPRLNPME